MEDASGQQQKRKSKQKKILFVFFLIMAAVSVIFLILSNTPYFIKDGSQFLRLAITAFFSATSLLFFTTYISTYPKEVIANNKKNKDGHTFSYWIGNFIISGLLAVLISVMIGFLSLPFMRVANGLPFQEQAKIGGTNMWRIVLIYGLLTATICFFCFRKKIHRILAWILIFFWVSGTGLVVFLNTLPNGQFVQAPQNPVKDNYITDRTTCDKQTTLQKMKGCVLRILRDDGGHGTGFVIKQGYLITNKHVLEGAKEISVYLNGEKNVNVWNYSSDFDIAVLKLPESSLVNTCSWFDSNRLNIAEELYTFGWPNDPTGDSTVTKGIYSRTNKYADGTEDIQTDASINPGSSGGPLVNECGVVGINTTRADWTQEQSPRVIEGMGFALSSNFVHSIINELINNGNIAKGIPNQLKYQSSTTTPNYPAQTATLNLESIKSYLNDLYRVKSSWEQARTHVNSEKLDKLMDSFNRQIEFCNHLVDKLSNGQRASGDDINLWSAVIKMGEESANLTNELNK